jgi:hypothetical protein
MARSFGLDLSDSGQGPVAIFFKNDNELHVPWNVVHFMALCVAAYVWRSKQRDGISYITFIHFHLLGC